MAAPEAWFRSLTLHSLLSGASALVPLPWIDEHFISKTREHQIRQWAKDLELDLPEIEVRILAGSERPFRATGCIIGALTAATWRIARYFLRKIVRTVLFFLLIKEATEVASATFHQGYLAQRALSSESLVLPLGTDRAWRIRRAIEETCDEIDTRPVHQILRRGLRGSRAFATWAFTLGRNRDAERLGRWQYLVDSVSGALWEQEGYLEALGQSFNDRLKPKSSVTPSSPGRI